LKKTATAGRTGNPKTTTPGSIDYSRVCPASGSFVDLTAINFLIQTEKLTRPNAEKRFLELVEKGVFVPAGQIGLLGNIPSFRFNPQSHNAPIITT
jgi:hypothetical protein